jgi:hypothetical protein
MVNRGEVVVKSVVNVVSGWSLFGVEKMDSFLNFIFAFPRRCDHGHCWEAGEAVDLWLAPEGLGRRTRKAVIPATMMPMMMNTRSGLGKLVLLSGGGVVVSIPVGCGDSGLVAL